MARTPVSNAEHPLDVTEVGAFAAAFRRKAVSFIKEEDGMIGTAQNLSADYLSTHATEGEIATLKNVETARQLNEEKENLAKANIAQTEVYAAIFSREPLFHSALRAAWKDTTSGHGGYLVTAAQGADMARVLEKQDAPVLAKLARDLA